MWEYSEELAIWISDFVILSALCPAIFGIEANIGKKHTDALLIAHHSDLSAHSFIASAEYCSAFLNAKPN
jgi:hypothetical protein